MKIYLVTAPGFSGYDTFDAMVVVERSAEAAILRHPAETRYAEDLASGAMAVEDVWDDEDGRSWPVDPGDLRVFELGTAAPGEQPGVVIASFHAG
jgi:hypothetical protein